jgi:iron complex transport system substrate-binding protein
MKRIGQILVLACLLAAGCQKPKSAAGVHPRIITFAPHITDIAYDMGLADHVVGVTNFCIVPLGRRPAVVGNALKINGEAILQAEPDILFYNTRQSDYDTLRKLAPSLQLVRVRNDNLAQLREGIAAMGRAVGREDLSAAMLSRMDGELDAVRQAVAGRPRPRVLFVMGTEHPATAGAGSMLDDLINIAGGANVAAEADLKDWGRINIETVYRLRPDVLICQCEAGEDNVRAAREYWTRLSDLPAVTAGRVHVLDDPRLTIYGSKVGQTARELAEMICPEAFQAQTRQAKEAAP